MIRVLIKLVVKMLLYMSLAGPQVPYGHCHQLIYLDFASVSDGLWGREEA